MPNYHFEDDDKEFGATIDVSRIQKRVQDEERRRPAPPSRKPQSSRSRKGGKPPYQLLILIAVILGILAFLVVFIVSFRLSGGKNDAQQGEGNPPVADGNATHCEAVVRSVESNALSVYNITGQTVTRLTISADAAITNAAGNAVSLTSFMPGDMITYDIDGVTGSVTGVQAFDGGFTLANVTDLTFETGSGSKRVEIKGQDYLYSGNTVVVRDGALISLSDLAPVDVLTLRGSDGNIYAIDVETYHGTLSFLNTATVKGITLTLDDAEEGVLLDENPQVAVAAGAHTIKLTGEGIEDYVADNIYITEGEDKTFDLAILQGKTSLLVLTVDVTGYDLYIDGEKRDAMENPLVVSIGEHTIKLTKADYQDFEQTVTITEEPYELSITMVPTVQYSDVIFRSTPSGATVYVDNENIGVAPVMRRMAYGSYTVRFEWNDGGSSSQSVIIDSQDPIIEGIPEEE